MPTIGSAAKESASAKKTLIGGASREPLSPGNLREPGLREAALGSGHRGTKVFFVMCFCRK